MKNKKKDETIDMTTLPKINVVTTSLLLDFKNLERRLKLLENIYKQPEKNLRMITREQIIEFAKENKIYIDPEEGKKPNPKDPPIEKKDITAEELAKAAAGAIVDRSVPVMKDKKALMDKIEELKKQKEEAICLRDNPVPVDPKVKPKPGDKKKDPVNPDDIIIPVIDEMNTDLIILFYNFPLDEAEYKALEEERVVLNHIYCVRETDEFVEDHKEEVQLDKNGKPIKAQPAKDLKPSNEQLLLQKYFNVPSKDSAQIFSELLHCKQKSHKHSLFRLTFNEHANFSYKVNDESKKDPFIIFQEEYAAKMNLINRSYLHYLKWVVTVLFQKFSPESQRKTFAPTYICKFIQESDIKLKDFEQISHGTLLFAFCSDLLKTHRMDMAGIESNNVIYEKNDVDDLFNNLENEILYEYGKELDNNIMLFKKSNSNEILLNENERNNSLFASSHLQSDRMKESQDVDNKMIDIDELSTPFKLIIDENDFILKSSIQNRIEGKSISDKEKELQIFRNFPGIGRHLMPILAPVEENKRKAIKCEIYPFLEDEINIPIYEKFLVLKKFEQLLKEKIPEQNFDFGNRIYQEVMNRDILTQAINHALLYDTECAYVYNERDDNLLLASYYRCPKGRLYRKTSRTRYLSKPDFENWIKFFRPTFNVNPLTTEAPHNNNHQGTPNANNATNMLLTPTNNIAQPNVLPNTENKPSVKRLSHADPHSLIFGIPYDPEVHTLYEADDTCIGEVTERIKYMFPSDNGVFIRKIVENGIFTSHSSYVVKDNLTFGIRKNNQNVPELWIKFENDVLLTCNYLGEFNPYLFGPDTEPKNDSENGTYTTITYKSGLNVQIMPDGDICQKVYTQEDSVEGRLSNDELYRIITSKASVVRYFPLEKISIMYSNGNVCNIQNGLATNTNNKGYRLAKRLDDETLFEIDSIPITIQSDPETNTKTLIRDDKVIHIKYPDQSALTIHSDDTKIYTYPDNLKYLIEHDNFASTEIVYDPVKKRTKTTLSDSDALLGSDNIMTRSYDGRLSNITLPDKTLVFTYKEKKTTDEFDKYTFNTVTLVYRPDGTVIKVQQDGDICVITSNERMLMNKRGQNLNVFDGKDTDYLFDLNGKPEERKRGCYTVDMKKSKIWTRDDEDNLFELHADGSSKCKMKVTLDLQNSQVPIDEMRPVTPKYDTPDYIDEEARFSDAPSNFISPRLFVIENDNTGYELLQESQIANFKIIKAKDKLHAKYYSQTIEDNFVSHYWLTKYQSVNELIKETHFINSIKIPKKLEKITQTPVSSKFPPHEIHYYRNLIESKQLDAAFRDKVLVSVNNKDQWFSKRKIDFGVLEGSTHAPELQENAKIQRRILEERQIPDLKFSYNGLLDNLLCVEEMRQIEINENMSILFDIEEHVNEKERKKIIEDRNFRILPMRLENSVSLQEVLGLSSEEGIKRKNVIDTKAMQEIKFISDFSQCEFAKQSFVATSNAPVKKNKNSRKRENRVGRGGSSKNINDDLFVDETNPNGLEAVLSRIQMKSLYSNEENSKFNPTQLSPIVLLENEKMTSNNKPFDPKKSPKKKFLPSIYKMTIEKMKEMKQKEKNDAEVWINNRNYKYAHDGSPRSNNPLVPNYLKTTFPEAEFNEDYIYIEKLTDKRLKTSSVAKRLYFNAPSVNDIRKSGQHNFLVEALDKKKTYEEMMERLNLMISSELCDPLNKMLKVDPVILDFGYLKVGSKYQMLIKLRNDDNMTNRVQIRKNFNNKNLNVENFIGGKITPGETKRVKVTIDADDMMVGKLNEVIQIQTKSFIYKVPVSAIILFSEEFEKLNAEKITKSGICLPINAEIYQKASPMAKTTYKKEILKEEIKDKKFPDIFDATPYLKYLVKPKENDDSEITDENKLPNI